MTTETSTKPSVKDMKFMLSLISDTLHIYDYPTSSIFSAVTRCSIVGYLYGIGYTESEDLTNRSVTIFRHLTNYAQNNSEYGVHWDGNLVCSTAWNSDGERLTPESGTTQYHTFAVHKELFEGLDF